MMQRLHHHGGDLEGHGLVDVMADMTASTASACHQLIVKHARYHGLGARASILDNWEISAEIPQGDAGRIPARAGRAAMAANVRSRVEAAAVGG